MSLQMANALKLETRMHESVIEQKYYQTEAVLSEIQIIRTYSRTVFEKFTTTGRLSSGEKVRLETLVTFLREKIRSGDKLLIKNLAATILENSKSSIGFIASQLAGGRRERIPELIDSITSVMWEKLLKIDQSQQFWEANFQTCLKNTACNCLTRLNRDTQHEMPQLTKDEDGIETDRLEFLADENAPDPLRMIIIDAALHILTMQERTVLLLSVKEGWTHQEIGEKLSITDRTVRNILTRTEKKFAGLRDDAC